MVFKIIVFIIFLLGILITRAARKDLEKKENYSWVEFMSWVVSLLATVLVFFLFLSLIFE